MAGSFARNDRKLATRDISVRVFPALSERDGGTEEGWRIIERETGATAGGALLGVDRTTGQNALSQASSSTKDAALGYRRYQGAALDLEGRRARGGVDQIVVPEKYIGLARARMRSHRLTRRSSPRRCSSGICGIGDVPYLFD